MEFDHVIVHRTPHAYSSHPCITRLARGEWLIAFSQSIDRDPFLHPPADPRFANLIVRSTDEGRSWSEPCMAPDYTGYGTENPGIVELSTGEVLLNQWRFDWMSTDLAHKRWSAGGGEYFVCRDRGEGRHGWRPARSAADWDAHAFPYVRTDGGAFVHISRDGGRTWEVTIPIDISPYRGAFSPKGALELSSGDVLLALGSHDYDPLHASFVVRSTTKGHTWGRPVEVARLPAGELSEPSIAETSTGRIVCMSRDEVSGFIYQSDSLDGGESWAPARRLGIWGYPTHVVTLRDGRLLIVYGRRRAPFGIRAAVSDDDGRTWAAEFTVRELPNFNLGYPSVIEYEPGRLFTAYYGEDLNGITCIQGTYFTLD